MIDQDLYNQTKDYFNKNNYVVIRNFIDQSTANLFYQYSIVKVQRTDFFLEYAKNDYRLEWDGQFGDMQSPTSYSCYADPLMETLLLASTGLVEKYLGMPLTPQYSYWRFYQKDEELKRHRDRESCEISLTMCLGFNVSNVKDQEDYNWPMWVETDEIENQDGAPVYLNPGDVIIYRGCELDHWREKFKGLNHAQVFLHYNDQNGPYKNIFDGRPILGIPKRFQKDTSV